eukprot:12889294-Prorocentrum_lima.AAC.1
MTFEEIAKETGISLRSVQFDFPAADVWILHNVSEILNLRKAMWGLKDAPPAFGMRLSRTLKEIGCHQG